VFCVVALPAPSNAKVPDAIAALSAALSAAEEPTSVRREDGKWHIVDAIGAMFRRYCVGTKDGPVDRSNFDFGFA